MAASTVPVCFVESVLILLEHVLEWICRMEAVLVVEAAVPGEPSIVFSACADGHVLRWELDTDLNADSYK